MRSRGYAALGRGAAGEGSQGLRAGVRAGQRVVELEGVAVRVGEPCRAAPETGSGATHVYFSSTLRALASVPFGRWTRTRPFSNSALIFVGSTFRGRVNERSKAP